MRIAALLGSAIALLTASPAMATTHTVSITKNGFSVQSQVIRAGDTIQFLNQDTINHEIYSGTSIAPFDLGSFGPGEMRKVKFSKAGPVQVLCSLHPLTAMIVQVQ